MFIIQRRINSQWVRIANSELSAERQMTLGTVDPGVFRDAAGARVQLVYAAKRYAIDCDYRVIRQHGDRATYMVNARSVQVWKREERSPSVAHGMQSCYGHGCD